MNCRNLSVNSLGVKNFREPSHRGEPYFCEFCLQELDQVLTGSIWEKFPCASGRRKQSGYKNGWNTWTHTSAQKIKRWQVCTWKDAPYVIRELPIKTIGSYLYTPIRIAKIQNTENTKYRRGCGASGTLIHTGGNEKWLSHFGR